MIVISTGAVAMLLALAAMVETSSMPYAWRYFDTSARMNGATASRLQRVNQASFKQTSQDMTLALAEQTGPSTFRHISSLDMDIPGESCPSNLALKTIGSHRLCQRTTNGDGCDSVIISTGGQTYTKVRGRIAGYAFNTPDAFRRIGGAFNTIDDPYVDGVSITYGNPRSHVFTYAAAAAGVKQVNPLFTCPEIGDPVTKQPGFVSNKFICAVAGDLVQAQNRFFDVPLWTTLGNCVGDCPDNLQFCVTLDEPTTEDLELRICTDQAKNDEEIYIKSFDFYIQ